MPLEPHQAIEADFLRELVEIQAEYIDWVLLDEGAYLRIGSNEIVIQIVGIAKFEMASSNVLWLT